MTIRVGDQMPSGVFGVMSSKGPTVISSKDLFTDKKIILISVPGAFTPTCSINHLSSYLNQSTKIKSSGIDLIACMAVNDVFVMNAWAKEYKVDDKITMLSDGNGDYVKALGLEQDSRKFGMGIRSQRFSSIIDNGIIKYLQIDKPGQFEVSKVEYLLEEL